MKRVSLSFPALRSGPVDPRRVVGVLLVLAAACVLRADAAASPSPVAATAASTPPAPVTSHQQARDRVVPKTPPGYLPRLGPPPLRVLRPRPASTNGYVLPPLAMKDVEPPVETNKSDAATPPASASAPATTASVPTLFPALPPVPDDTAPLVKDPGVELPAPGAIFTPQMLVQFFKPAGSNRVAGGWSVPVFVPPVLPSAPGPVRSSSATYSTPPP